MTFTVKQERDIITLFAAKSTSGLPEVSLFFLLRNFEWWTLYQLPFIKTQSKCDDPLMLSNRGGLPLFVILNGFFGNRYRQKIIKQQWSILTNNLKHLRCHWPPCLFTIHFIYSERHSGKSYSEGQVTLLEKAWFPSAWRKKKEICFTCGRKLSSLPSFLASFRDFQLQNHESDFSRFVPYILWRCILLSRPYVLSKLLHILPAWQLTSWLSEIDSNFGGNLLIQGLITPYIQLLISSQLRCWHWLSRTHRSCFQNQLTLLSTSMVYFSIMSHVVSLCLYMHTGLKSMTILYL